MTLLSEQQLRERVERLAELDRESCSEGEREGARLLARELESLGAFVSTEAERAHGTYWWPIGLATAAAAAAGARGGRSAALVGALAAAAVADDVSAGPHVLRRALLRRRTTVNVSAELGDPDAPQKVVFVAHHDSAHSGLVFHPGLPRALMRRFKFLRRAETTPPTMWGAVYGPLVMALGSLVSSRKLRRCGTCVSAGYAVAMADIGLRRAVPAANDNASGVAALLSLAHSLAADPPAGVRAILLFPGSEESFMEGMRAWTRRHLAHLPRESTCFVCLDTVGSPRLLLLEGEGMLRMNEYPKDFLAFVRSCAEEAGIDEVLGLRFRNATDALIALKAGYRTAMIGSVDEFKIPTNYHWPTDTPERLDYSTVDDAARLCRRIVERLSARAPAASPVGERAYAAR